MIKINYKVKQLSKHVFELTLNVLSYPLIVTPSGLGYIVYSRFREEEPAKMYFASDTEDLIRRMIVCQSEDLEIENTSTDLTYDDLII